jgi:hypothetical protein
MITKNKVIVALVAIIIIMCFCFKMCNRPAPVKPSTPTVKEQKDNRTKIEKDDKRVQDSLNKKIDSLTTQSKVLKKGLKNAQEYVNVLLNGMSEKTDTTTDYIECITYEEVAHLIVANKEKDSLANATISTLDSVIANQTHKLTAKDTLYNRLGRYFDEALINQTKLQSYSKQLEKQVKRKKAANVVWKVVAVAGGLFILNEKIK